MNKAFLTDGNFIEFEKEQTAFEVLGKLSQGLQRAALIVGIDGKLCDLDTVLDGDCNLTAYTFDSEEGKKAFWHTSSHILAMAVKRLFPKTKLAIGPAISNGFYYDFDSDVPFTADTLNDILAEMKKIVKDGLGLSRFVKNKDEALSIVESEPYKSILINELPEGEEISFYKLGEFTDLCAGPHLKNISSIKAIALTSVTGAYWKGNSKNKMLYRIYGVSFPKAAMLEEHLAELELARSRDHNKLGRELKYFTTCDAVGQGLPLLMPKGAKVISILSRFIEDESEKRGYMMTKTPIMAKSDLYKISGHWDHYRDGMFIMGDKENEQEILALRPMTCPFQFMIYLNELHSYKELPIRYAETSTLCRNESSGEMHGLIRVRQFTLSDAHIITTPQTLEDEFARVLDFINFVMEKIGISQDIWYRFSKWDPKDKEKYIDNSDAWEETQVIMKGILDRLQVNYTEADGEAAFYGPKLDIQMKNVHGKEDTIITIQIDFALAERFSLEYIDSDGSKKHPYIIHHSIIGCYERTLAMLIEKYAGALPFWISPLQVKIIPIGDNQLEYAKKINEKLQALSYRCEIDSRNEKIGYKIRQAQLEKAPFMLVIGEKEVNDNLVSVRSRVDGDLGAMTLEQFINKIN